MDKFSEVYVVEDHRDLLIQLSQLEHKKTEEQGIAPSLRVRVSVSLLSKVIFN